MKLFNKKPQTVQINATVNTTTINPTTCTMHTAPNSNPLFCPEKPKAGKTTLPSEACQVHNLIILDESGSMSSIYHAALTGVNETLQTIRQAQIEHDNQEHTVTLVSFDSMHYKAIYNNTPALKIADITTSQYQPCGGTPLYDAMGRAITELKKHVKSNDVVLVTIITDGYENASHEYNGVTIKALVEEMKAQDWVFTYIGANQDVAMVAKSLSIENHLEFKADPQSTAAMFAYENKSRKNFYGKIKKEAITFKPNDFFAE